ncbi:MAG: methyl-accepting chemotaxis protein [Candidatus Omnitrophota bacterium]|jgi:methyl-accepting chemotaxis protein
MGQKYKRRQYFIDRSFQTKFILRFCLVVIASALIIGGLVLFLSRNSTTVAIENTEVVVKGTADFILPVVVSTTLMVTLLSAIAVSLITLVTSHKIAGPLFRLKREIDFLKEGDLRRNFNIRSKDQLQNLSKSLNQMCEALRQRDIALKDKCSTLNDCLNAGNIVATGEGKDKIVGLLEEINSLLSRFKT